LLNDVRRLEGRLDQTVKRFVALGLERGEPLPETLPASWRPRLQADPRNGARLRTLHRLSDAAPLVALLPGAEYGAAKRWPAAQFGALAAALIERGTEIVVLGSQKERPLGEEIEAVARSARVHNLCGQTTLGDVVDLLTFARVAVSNDSGLLHVAAAAGAAVVAIYGSSSPQFTPPLTDKAAIVTRRLPCSPCFARECPLGHLDCLRGLPVATVLGELDALAACGNAVADWSRAR
jgi:heptosyltransferase-2